MDYLRIYNRLIEKRKREVLTEENCDYFEIHHIKPRSIYPDLVNDKENLIALTPKEHYFAHHLLKEIYKKQYGDDSDEYWKLFNAFWLMSHAKRYTFISAQRYEALRKEINDFWSDKNKTKEIRLKMSKAKKGKPSPKKGIPLSEEHKEKLRLINLGKKHSPETIEKIRQANLGKQLSEEHKQILIQSRLGSKHTEETKERIRQKKLGFRHTEETKKKIGEASAKFMTGRKLPKEVCENIRKSKSGEKNPNFGKKWMFNEQTNHRLCVKIEEVEEYKKMGYKLGKNGKGGKSHDKKYRTKV